MFEILQRMPDRYRGILYIAGGILVLLYALGFIGKSATVIVVLFALYLILMGIVKVGLYRAIVDAITHKKR